MSEIIAGVAVRDDAPRTRPAAAAALWRVFRDWRQRRRTRRHLCELDDCRLRDVGLSRRQAFCEARKSFPWHLSFPWNVEGGPDTWR